MALMKCSHCNGTGKRWTSWCDDSLMSHCECELNAVDCSRCYGRGIKGDDKYNELDKKDIEEMEKEIEHIKNGKDSEFIKQFLISTVKLLRGRFEIPK